MKPKFKVGDKVEIISNAHNNSGKDMGTRFIIEEVSIQGIRNDQIYYRSVFGITNGVREPSLELVNEVITEWRNELE